MREFPSGAIRDNDVDKLDYEAFLSPLVLKRYAEYLHKHRKQADGQMRSGDNWQKGIPLNVYMKSKCLHFQDTHLIHRGFPEEAAVSDIEETLCAELFNTMGYLFEVLIEKKRRKEEDE